MKIKYSPCKYNEYTKINVKSDTEITVKGDNAIIIDDEVYEFDINSVAWHDILHQTNGAIIDAYRDETGELWLTIRRFYTGSCAEWDTGAYHEINR